MYVTDEELEAAEAKYGTPVVVEMECDIHPWEYDVVDGSMGDGRAHDVTMFIHKIDDPRQLALIKKPFFPEGAFRAPSGAATPGEGLERGALREAHEETGLDIELDRYLLRIHVKFICGAEVIDWTSHIFEARQVAGELDPIDTGEIEEACWASIEELQGPIRRVLLESGWDLFQYRVALTDLTIALMEEGG